MNKLRIDRLAAFLCASLLLISCMGCGDHSKKNIPEAEEHGTKQFSEQVIEVGILADCSDPYTVVTYESFVWEAGLSDLPIVVEVHDCRNGLEALLWGIEQLKQTGVDVVLMDVVPGEEQKVLIEELSKWDIPVLFFGTIPMEEILECTDGSYIGLTEEEMEEYLGGIGQESFEESGYREKANTAGKELFECVVVRK